MCSQFADPATWESSLKEIINFWIVDIQPKDNAPFRAVATAVACGDLCILSVQAPTAFTVEKYEHDCATIYLPYRNCSQCHAAWIAVTKVVNGPWADMVNRDHVLAALGLIEADDLGYEAEIPQSCDEFSDEELEDLQESILSCYSSLRHPLDFTKSDLSKLNTVKVDLRHPPWLD